MCFSETHTSAVVKEISSRWELGRGRSSALEPTVRTRNSISIAPGGVGRSTRSSGPVDELVGLVQVGDGRQPPRNSRTDKPLSTLGHKALPFPEYRGRRASRSDCYAIVLIVLEAYPPSSSRSVQATSRLRQPNRAPRKADYCRHCWDFPLVPYIDEHITICMHTIGHKFPSGRIMNRQPARVIDLTKF